MSTDVTAAISAFKHSISGYKGCITRAQNHIKALKDKEVKDEMFVPSISTLLKNVNTYFGKIQEIEQSLLSLLTKPEDIQKFTEKCSDYHFETELFLNLEEAALQKFIKPTKKDDSKKSDGDSKDEHLSNFHLSKINLPIYNGSSLLDFPAWYDAFTVAVHTNEKLSDIKKYSPP